MEHWGMHGSTYGLMSEYDFRKILLSVITSAQHDDCRNLQSAMTKACIQPLCP